MVPEISRDQLNIVYEAVAPKLDTMGVKMRKQVLAMLLLASPAWGAGNASEALCDDPGSGVTCECSEPLTANDGSHTSAFDPTSTKGCRPDGISVSSQATDFIPSSSLSYPITVGGDGFVLRAIGGKTNIVNDDWSNREFTDSTLCFRTYQRWHPDWECNGDCNIKGLRQERPDGERNPGTESGWASHSAGGGEIFEINFGGFRTPEGGTCSASGGCGNGGRLARNRNGGDDITFEDMQTGWARLEWCFDHNVSEAQHNSVAPYLAYPGPDHMYMRARHTMITGPYAGRVQTWGPGYQPNPIATSFSGTVSHLTTTFVSAGFSTTRADAYVSHVMIMKKSPADPNWWIGPAIEVEGVEGDRLPPTPIPTATPSPTPTSPPAGDSSAGGPSGQVGVEVGCPGSASPDPAVLHCDAFDDGIPISAKWNAYNDADGNYLPVGGVGVDGSTAMRAIFQPGQVTGGFFSIGLGQLPAYYPGAGENWQHVVSPESKFRDIYWREYVRLGAGWSGIPFKHSRVRVLVPPGPDDLSPHPTAFQGHFWPDTNTKNAFSDGILFFNNTRGVDANGELTDLGNNTNTSVWLPRTAGQTVIFKDYPQGSDWLCIEAHIKLNDPGLSNGIEEYWIDDQLEARRTDQNQVGTYTDFGLNQVVFDNYWNGGSPQQNTIYRDNMVVSTRRIGCTIDTEAPPGPADLELGRPGTPYIVGQ